MLLRRGCAEPLQAVSSPATWCFRRVSASCGAAHISHALHLQSWQWASRSFSSQKSSQRATFESHTPIGASEVHVPPAMVEDDDGATALEAMPPLLPFEPVPLGSKAVV